MLACCEYLIGTVLWLALYYTQACRFFCSYLWGALADYKGRKPTIIGSILLVGLSAFVFGFSVNYGMAIAFRFASGLCNGEPAIHTINRYLKLHDTVNHCGVHCS